MSTFKLSLPTDIPWRRMCVSKDMLDPLACDDARPPRWHSSMAAFRYDPAEEYQPYEDYLVTYVKVVCTIAPFQWVEPGATPVPDFVPEEIADEVAESHPCYGAVLQVSVGPREADQSLVSPEHYPYFIDCEPKKRELYEAVTDTGEVLSGSMSSVSVGKSATTVHSTEDYNLDLGGGGGFGLGWGAVNVNWSGQEQTGTVTRDSRQIQNVRSTDFSTERREVQSHTTQLTQMYNLFQAFHLGTNRAIFYIEPRPHIQQSEKTFINGPRAIEGMQEVFLTVVRHKRLPDFCVGALLETAHITEQPVYEVKTKSQTYHYTHNALTDTADKSISYSQTGWIVDTSKGSGGYSLTLNPNELLAGPPQIVVAADGTWIKLTTHVAPLVGHIELDLTVFLKQAEPSVTGYARRLFLTARELCCCPPRRAAPPVWVTTVVDLTRYRIPFYVGPGSPERFEQSRQLAAAVRKEMVRSFGSFHREERGRLKYEDSDAFHTRIADLLRVSKYAQYLDAPLTTIPEIDDATTGRLAREFGGLTVGDLLQKTSAEIAGVLKVEPAEAARLKQRIFGTVARRHSDRTRT
jgi:hypothetical protein